jgi:hypothetical protein
MFEALNEVLSPVQLALDLTRGELYFLINLILSYPLAYLHKEFTSSAFQRHLFSLVVGAVYAFQVFGEDSIHFWITATFVYLLMRFFPRSVKVWGVTLQAHLIVYIFALFYLFGGTAAFFFFFFFSSSSSSSGHIYTTYYYYMEFSLNWCASQMMLTIKLTGSAYDYYDGNSGKELDSYQKKRAIHTMPSLLEWFSYIFFFPTLLCGPPGGLKEVFCFGFFFVFVVFFFFCFFFIFFFFFFFFFSSIWILPIERCSKMKNRALFPRAGRLTAWVAN